MLDTIEGASSYARSPAPMPHDSRLIVQTPRRVFRARTQLVRCGSDRFEAHIVISGMVGRYTLTSDGSRQFTALLLPGDVIGIESLFNVRSCDNAIALTATVCLPVGSTELYEPAIRNQVWEALESQMALASEWTLNLGARPGLQRLAYFFHTTMTRMQALGNGDGIHYLLPLTQVELADFLALTPVHVNRCLAVLKATGHATFQRGRLVVLDGEGLRRLADCEGELGL